jgi:hypothetical protein
LLTKRNDKISGDWIDDDEGHVLDDADEPSDRNNEINLAATPLANNDERRR